MGENRQQDKKPTVEAERRRPGAPTPPGRRERAEAPQRQRESGAAGAPVAGPPPTGGAPAAGPSLTGGPPAAGPSLTGGLPTAGVSLPGLGKLFRSPVVIGLVLVVLFGCLLLYMCRGGLSSLGGLGTTYLEETEPAGPGIAQPEPTRRPTLPPAVVGEGKTWTVLLYQDADDRVLEQDIFIDLNEAERVGSGPHLNIVAQIDRYQAGFTGDGNWTSSRRYLVRQDDDLNAVSSDLLMELGEVNMADGKTLVDFVTWAVENYPADKYVLILSDHGMGWPGGWSDASAPRSGGQVPLQRALGDNLYLNELDQALKTIRARTGIDRFELIGMDACLMGHIEVLSALAPHARYAVLSQETEPALGWAYAAFLNELRNNPGIDGARLGQVIVDSYIVDDQRIVDERARADLVGGGNPLASLFGPVELPSAAQVARQMGQSVTLSAIDLQAMDRLMKALDDLALVLQGVKQRDVAQARSYAQSFTNVFGRDVPSGYIDLGHFAQLVARSSGRSEVATAVANLQSALQRAVIAEKHGSRLAGATGISIYFPNSQLYASAEAGAQSYTAIANRFATESLWDDFLAFHYTGKPFSAGRGTVAVPAADETLRSPAAGGIRVSNFSASAREVAPGQQIRLSVDIEGENIGYVKLLVGYLDKEANSIYLADSDYLASPDTRQIGGVYYPDWGAKSFRLTFDWEPIVYAIDDGRARYPALFTPETYGVSSEEAVYSVEGIYTLADSGTRLNARLYFANGVLQRVLSFTGEGTAGAPREIVPRSGDTFTILDKWIDLDNQGQVVQAVRQPGETLTFGRSMFTWEVLDAAAGDYVVGFIVEDLDGNSQVVFQPITVR